ncbi:MAG: phage antirepressor protein [Nanoarchaeota archaeon]|nr:phage antirepressor protein [Nanoarchaeota archaeon]
MEKLVVFQGKNIRRKWYREEWYFSIVDIIFTLTESSRPRKYWSDLKTRLIEEGFELSAKIGQLKLTSTDGKRYLTDCANTESMFRIIQSIPSKKAEPFKRWLAQVGYERIEEIENPELAQKRMKEMYHAKGYPKDWIDKRLRGIAIRQNLTDEWEERGIKEEKDFAILTAEISKATFGMTPTEYKEHKNLPKSKVNLRDHMNDLELIFTMLGERVTTEISQKEKPNTFNKNKKVAKRGGNVAGNARKDTEKELNRPITTKQNYLAKKELLKE